MNRFFGTKKAPAPAPSMEEAAGRVDGRVGTLDAKVVFHFAVSPNVSKNHASMPNDLAFHRSNNWTMN
jgi:hypothetical protein